MGCTRSKLNAPLVAFLIALLRFIGSVTAAEQKPLWLVVGSADLVRPIEALAEKRRSEGFEAVISAKPVEQALAATARRPDFLLLVGDDEPGKQRESWYLPAKPMKLYRWRRSQAQQFASDAAWGDLDGDLVPDVAVGRIPARTPGQVELVVKKILAFERQPPTAADLRLIAWAGSPQYGAVIDAVATEFYLMMFRADAPDWMSPWVISGNPHHPLCGWPPDQPTLFTRQVRRGGICGVLMGHASAESFFSMVHQGQRISYTASAAQAELAKGPPAPPLVFISCESGNFVGPAPCMAEAFLFFSGGPVATIGATTESHPLTNYFSGVSLLQALAGMKKRIGTVWLDAQRQATKARNLLVERVLRDVEGKLEEEIDVAKLRRDQILMYALLGDPATPLRIPEPLTVSVQHAATRWRWRAERPEGATGLQVSFRSAQPRSIQWQEKPARQEEARAAFKDANADLSFTEVSSLGDDDPWEGTVEKAGWLRFVATGAGKIHVAVFRFQ